MHSQFYTFRRSHAKLNAKIRKLIHAQDGVLIKTCERNEKKKNKSEGKSKIAKKKRREKKKNDENERLF